MSKMKSLDLIGVSILTAALILFIYAVTTGANARWDSVAVIVPILVAVGLFVAFFVYEARIPPEGASL